MRHATERGPASKAFLGVAAALSIWAASACAVPSAPNTTPPKSKILQMPGFRASLPPGKGWEGLAERSIRTASFSKKWGGFMRAVLDDQWRADIAVTALLVPPEHWSTAIKELSTFLRNQYALSVGLGLAAGWVTLDHAGRTIWCAKREDFIDGTESSTGLDSFSDEPQFKESGLFGLFFPPDLEKTHRYFEIYVRITDVDGLLKLHDDERLPLLKAVVEGLEIVGPFDDLTGPAGALARAILAGDQEAALKAVDEGADVNGELPDWTPLEIAAHCDRRDIAGLIDRGAGLAGTFDKVQALTPFLLALIADRPDIAALLLDRGARAGNGPEEGPSLLILASGLGYPSVAAKLVESGADVDVRAVGGRTPLMFACESGSLECARILIEAGASLDLRAEDGGTALLTAVDWGRAEIMRLLLDSGAEINIQDNEGWSCLLVAIFQGDAGLVGELIAAGADVDANVFATGQTALLQALQGDKFDIARTLLAAGANASLHKDGQVTPLMVAAAKGQSDLVLFLIEKGADVNVRTDDRKTALAIAESSGQAAIVEMLIKAGAKK
jgi:uncharacterized protein